MEDEEIIMQQGTPHGPMVQQIPMRSFVLTAAGDFLLVLGVLFILLGVANFITDFLGIKGSGEVVVGLSLCIVAGVILARSSQAMRVMMVQQQQMQQQAEQGAKKNEKEKGKEPSGYR
jgi:uncharacterized integral membrane protein